MAATAPVIAGDLEIAHFEITDKKSLKKALDSPCTQISHLYVKKGLAADFIKSYNSGFEKYVSGEKFSGMWLAYPYEDPFSFYAFLGWQSEKDHYDAMNKDGYKNFRASFKDCINSDKDKGIKIYHIELRKVYGDL